MDNLPSKKIKDIRGERFGRLVVEDFDHVTLKRGKNVFWKCRCDCGEIAVVSSSPLRAGNTQSCGCLAREVSRKLMKSLHNIGEHLYVIECAGYYKIGRANDVKQRLTQVQTANPLPVTLILEKPEEGYREKEFHELHKQYHHSGEWFTKLLIS